MDQFYWLMYKKNFTIKMGGRNRIYRKLYIHYIAKKNFGGSVAPSRPLIAAPLLIRKFMMPLMKGYKNWWRVSMDLLVRSSWYSWDNLVDFDLVVHHFSYSYTHVCCLNKQNSMLFQVCKSICIKKQRIRLHFLRPVQVY